MAVRRAKHADDRDRRWRRVASTHDLDELTGEKDAMGVDYTPNSKVYGCVRMYGHGGSTPTVPTTTSEAQQKRVERRDASSSSTRPCGERVEERRRTISCRIRTDGWFLPFQTRRRAWTRVAMGWTTAAPHGNCSVLLQIGAVVSFVGCWYAILISKWMPDTGIWMLDAIKQDTYYCLLVPYTWLIAIVFLSVNWFSMKVFKTA